MTISGIGAVSAVTFMATIDAQGRFELSQSSGHWDATNRDTLTAVKAQHQNQLKAEGVLSRDTTKLIASATNPATT